MTERERFEAWVSAPPRMRTPLLCWKPDSDWFGKYTDVDVQLAWEAWQEAQRPQIEDIGKALKDAGTGMHRTTD